MDLLPRLRSYGFAIAGSEGEFIASDDLNCGICDLYATRMETKDGGAKERVIPITVTEAREDDPKKEEATTDESSRCYHDFDVAKRESLGFFNDIPSQTWNRLKEKTRDMSPNYNPSHLPFPKTGNHSAYKPGSFYQNNYEPDFVCQHERRIGRYVNNHLDVWNE